MRPDKADAISLEDEGGGPPPFPRIKQGAVVTEVAALADLPTDVRVRRFLSFWTAKEARMKLTGEGLSLDPLDISLKLRDGEAVAYARPQEPHAELQFVSLSHAQAICCLATARDWLPPGR